MMWAIIGECEYEGTEFLGLAIGTREYALRVAEKVNAIAQYDSYDAEPINGEDIYVEGRDEV